MVYLSIGLALVSIALLALHHRQVKQNRQLEKLLDHTNQKLERLQVHFGRFTPEEVIEHLSESEEHYQATMRSVTVLFADLKGFTKMCRDRDPQEIVTILNGYFRRMSNALSSHHGQVTELTGDGLLCLFGALRSNPWQVQDAVRGALAMREALIAYNKELESKSLPSLAFGIGIHQGEVLAGVMGNFELSKFGVVGDPINMAARVESLTRQHQCDLLVTSEIKDALDDRFVLEEMPAVQVKGKVEPLVTYHVQSFSNARG